MNKPTVGIDFVSKNVQIKEKSVRLQLWDTAGQERFRSLIPGYLRDSHAVFLVFDVTNADSFQNLNMWLDYVKENRGEDVSVVIVGNKIDQSEERTVSSADAKEKLKYVGSNYFEVSAKTGENLETLFTETCAELLKGG
jgi:small GTP-binding protein